MTIIVRLGAPGWDAMEGSVSGDGCRPTIGAMKYGDALAIAELATALGNNTLAATYTQVSAGRVLTMRRR